MEGENSTAAQTESEKISPRPGADACVLPLFFYIDPCYHTQTGDQHRHMYSGVDAVLPSNCPKVPTSDIACRSDMPSISCLASPLSLSRFLSLRSRQASGRRSFKRYLVPFRRFEMCPRSGLRPQSLAVASERASLQPGPDPIFRARVGGEGEGLVCCGVVHGVHRLETRGDRIKKKSGEGHTYLPGERNPPPQIPPLFFFFK